MEKYFGNSYRGDPGVPHCDEDAFSNVWLGSMGFGVYAWNFPYFWTLARARKYTLDSSLFFCFYPLYNCHLFLWFFFLTPDYLLFRFGVHWGLIWSLHFYQRFSCLRARFIYFRVLGCRGWLFLYEKREFLRFFFSFLGVEGGRLEVNVLVSCSKMGLDFYWLFFFKTFIMVITLFRGML